MDAAPPKMEKDLSGLVDVQLPETSALAKQGKLTAAIEQLLVLEKQTRVACDLASNSRVLVQIVQLAFDAKSWKLLNEHVVLLSKKHGLLKQAITKMIQHAMALTEKVADMKTKLEFIDTLRTVTEGKIYVEVERARLTRQLVKIKEGEGKIAEAADILHELQVETFGSMEKREKTDFILEQMRLCLAKKDYTRTQIISKKISIKFFKDPANSDLKLRFYNLMVQHALYDQQYLNACKYYREIYDTQVIKDDEAKWREALVNVVLYIVLAPFDNEQSDLIHRIFEDPNLKKIDLLRSFAKQFITHELVRWSRIEEIFGAMLKQTTAFNPATELGKKSWADLRTRVIEHNIRVVAKYYTRISTKRLTQLLDLSEGEAESLLSKLVVNQTIWARIDRPNGLISFVGRKDSNKVLNHWSSNINQLLDSIAKSNHLITKEEMVHDITKIAV